MRAAIQQRRSDPLGRRHSAEGTEFHDIVNFMNFISAKPASAGAGAIV
jgi:hypothetical protein